MELNKYIDHTVLKAETTLTDIKKLCDEAMENNFFSVCINPNYVAIAKKYLKNSSVKICTVVGFPLGANTTANKVAEINDALANGADEIDMVMDIGWFLSENYDAVLEEFKECRKVTGDKILKVIFETCLLTDKQIIKACQLATIAKIDFVKTSTGFSKAGATVEHVTLMKQNISNNMQVKAAGGVRSKDDALAMINAGASRIGTSGGVAIVNNKINKKDY